MSLQSTVLVEHPKTHRLYVNFDQRITELCHEVKLLQMLRVPEKLIPESAKSITLHEITLSKYKDQLVELINQIESLNESINCDCKELMKPLLTKLQKRVQPLLVSVCWTSMNLQEIITKVKSQVDIVNETNSIVRDIMKNRINKYLREISETSFIPLYRRPARGSSQD